jgi:hypothetical protein
MNAPELKEILYKFIRPSYPDIKIEVIDTGDNIRSLYFITENFRLLYPKQRYHYLINLVSNDFFDKHLADTIWFELIPGENPDNLEYHGQETIAAIKEPILGILRNKVSFVSTLDKKFNTEKVKCFGDFRVSKKILADLQFSLEDQFDIFHVLMDEGGYCDCEILFNVFRESEYAKKYWSERYQ